jgi:hypothetical protein
MKTLLLSATMLVALGTPAFAWRRWVMRSPDFT